MNLNKENLLLVKNKFKQPLQFQQIREGCDKLISEQTVAQDEEQKLGISQENYFEIMNWIVGVSKDGELSCKCKQLAVSYINTYLYKKSIELKHLQLLAIAAIVLASKFIDSRQMKIDQAILITGNQYTEEEIENMELKLLEVLNWKLKLITPCDFSTVILQKLFSTLPQDCLQNIEDIIDYCLKSSDYSCQLPSSIAFTCMRIGLQASELNDEYEELNQFIQSLNFTKKNRQELEFSYQLLNSKFCEVKKIIDQDTYDSSEGILEINRLKQRSSAEVEDHQQYNIQTKDQSSYLRKLSNCQDETPNYKERIISKN